MNDKQTVRLSLGESKFVRKLLSSDCMFSDLLHSHSEILVNRESITLTHSDAETLRDYFTERLARAGFDPEYRPNEEGFILEGLIDKLFFPSPD